MKTLYIKTHWRNFKTIVFLSSILFQWGCDSFVDVELPKSQLTNKTIFEDYNTANAALADVYAKMRDSGILTGTLNGLSVQLSCYTDELDLYDTSSDATFAFYTNAVLPSNSNLSLFWNNSYNQIYASNAILEGIQASNLSAQEKAQLQGEALFIRGLLHFYLLQLFGNIPYIKTTDYKTNSIVARMSSDEVYKRIVDDLNTAEGLLSDSYQTLERVRPNSFTAKALLARIYLYKGDWENCKKMSTAVIESNTMYLFENDLDRVFFKNSTEAIWQFNPSLIGKNTDEGTIFIFDSGAPPLVALSESLINSFASNDLRKSHWTGQVNNETGKWYYPYKYKESQSSGTSKEYSMVMRLTEQYLIRSEARAELGNLAEAKEDLNKIRSRAGLANTLANSKEELLEAIVEERKKEFFTEYGHRFFDLKRTGKINTILSIKPGWNTTDNLLPIPESELIVNPNLKPQNPGY